MNDEAPNNPRINLDGSYDEYTVKDFQVAMAEGNLSAEALVAYYTDRILRFDRNGPCLNSVLYLNEYAPAQASTLDRERKNGKLRGPLHGIPILIKGNINTGDGMPTTAGSLALKGFMAPGDAAVVRRLKEAGAVILGKTNLSEWANFRSRHSTSGWSSEGGQTRNPWALDRNPCGSSSGSAVAVSANLCALAVGTETDGSITAPSSVNGIVGIKPGIGLVSQEGIIPISFSQDTAGPMARTLEDAAILLAAMVEKTGSAEPWMTQGFELPAGPGGALGGDQRAERGAAYGEGHQDLSGFRIALANNYSGMHPEIDLMVTRAADTLRALGAVVEETMIGIDPKLEEAELELLLYEFKYGLEKYLAAYGKGRMIQTLADLIAFNRDHAETVMPWFGQDLLEEAAKKKTLDEVAYTGARRDCLLYARVKGIDATMDALKLDAIIAPSSCLAWKTDHILGDHYMGGCSSLPAIAGYPHLTVPSGLVHGLPMGLSFFGRAGSEAILVRIGLTYERATRCRRKPAMTSMLSADRI